MSENKTSLKTEDVLIEICPNCNHLHSYHVADGVIIEVKKEFLTCGTNMGTIPQGESEKPITVLCGYIIKPKIENTFTIRRWSYRERQEFYKAIGAYEVPVTPGSTTNLKLSIRPEIIDKAIMMSVVKSPVPLSTLEDLNNKNLDGAVLEALYGEILDFNTPPLAPLSTSRRRFIRTTPSSPVPIA